MGRHRVRRSEAATPRAVQARAACALLALSALAAGCRDGTVARMVRQPHHVRVVWTEQPQTRALIAWDTGGYRGEVHRVYWAAGGVEGEPLVASVEAHATDEYDGRGAVHYHHAQLSGLPPASKIRFAVDSDGARSREFHFFTAPQAHTPFALLSGGDSRSHRESRQAMNRRLAVLADDPTVLALAHGGDYIFSGWKMDQWQAWLDDAALAVPESGRLLPIVPTRGNHEAGGQMFDEVFGWPGGGLGKNFFVTELSDEVALVTLNTERAAGGIQREFLERALREHADKRFRVVQYHRPIWPAVKSPYPGKYQWQPLFEALGVAFVLESDGHALKRTVPLRDDKQVEGGVVYLGEGGLGVKQRTPYASRWYLQAPGMASSAHHVWRLDFGVDAVTATAVGLDGAELDRTVLPPRLPDDR